MWSIQDYKRLSRGAMFVVFDSSVHGGSRKKSTGLLTTLEALVALEGSCQGDHEHLEWGYIVQQMALVLTQARKVPKLLCERFATLLSLQASVLELSLNPTMAKPLSLKKILEWQRVNNPQGERFHLWYQSFLRPKSFGVATVICHLWMIRTGLQLTSMACQLAANSCGKHLWTRGSQL